MNYFNLANNFFLFLSLLIIIGTGMSFEDFFFLNLRNNFFFSFSLFIDNNWDSPLI